MLSGPAEDALIEAIMAAHSQIDFLWQFFVTVHIAIFALLLLYDRVVESLNIIGRGIALAGITAFEWINGNALAGAYALLDSMHEQYRASYGTADRFHYSFYDTFVLADYATRPGMVLLTHSAALLIVLIAFGSRSFIQAPPGKDTRQP